MTLSLPRERDQRSPSIQEVRTHQEDDRIDESERYYHEQGSPVPSGDAVKTKIRENRHPYVVNEVERVVDMLEYTARLQYSG